MAKQEIFIEVMLDDIDANELQGDIEQLIVDFLKCRDMELDYSCSVTRANNDRPIY